MKEITSEMNVSVRSVLTVAKEKVTRVTVLKLVTVVAVTVTWLLKVMVSVTVLGRVVSWPSKLMLVVVLVVVVRVPSKVVRGEVVLVVVRVVEVRVKVRVWEVRLTITLVALLVLVVSTDRVSVELVLRVVKDRLSEVMMHVDVHVLVVLVLSVCTTSVVTRVGSLLSTTLMVVRVPLRVLVMQRVEMGWEERLSARFVRTSVPRRVVGEVVVEVSWVMVLVTSVLLKVKSVRVVFTVFTKKVVLYMSPVRRVIVVVCIPGGFC